jgi:hypothetical protein
MHLSAGADVGIGIGAAIVVLVFVGMIFWVYRRGKRKGKGEAAERATALKAPSSVGEDQDSVQVSFDHGFNQRLDYTKYELPEHGTNRGSQYTKYELPGELPRELPGELPGR